MDPTLHYRKFFPIITIKSKVVLQSMPYLGPGLVLNNNKIL